MSDLDRDGRELASMIAGFLRTACPDERVSKVGEAHDHAVINVRGRLGMFTVTVEQDDYGDRGAA